MVTTVGTIILVGLIGAAATAAGLVSKHVDDVAAEAEAAWEGKDWQRATDLLRRARSAASVVAPWHSAQIRMRLGGLYAQAALRHEAAVELRAAIGSPFLASPQKKEARLLLADILEGIGDQAGADEQRDVIRKLRREQNPHQAVDADNAAACLARGDALQKAHRYEDAVAEYEKALATRDAALREKLLVMAALAASNGGHPDRAIPWCDELLAGTARSPLYQRAAHGLAALSHANLGNLISAETHARERVRLAGDEPSQRCAALGILAAVLLQKGDLREAAAVAEEADRIGIGDSHHRAAWRVLADIHLQAGRFGEALTLHETAHESRRIERRQGDARSDAVDALAMARVFLTAASAGATPAGALGRARQMVDAAAQAYAGDPSASLPCDALRAWLLALEGKIEPAVNLIVDIERRRQQYQPTNRSLAVDCLQVCAHVSFTLGGFSQSAGYWQERLKICNPIARPESAYWLARCLEAMGDSRALYVYERAVATGIETLWLGQARERLAKSVVYTKPDPAAPTHRALELRRTNVDAGVG